MVSLLFRISRNASVGACARPCMHVRELYARARIDAHPFAIVSPRRCEVQALGLGLEKLEKSGKVWKSFRTGPCPRPAPALCHGADNDRDFAVKIAGSVKISGKKFRSGKIYLECVALKSLCFLAVPAIFRFGTALATVGSVRKFSRQTSRKREQTHDSHRAYDNGNAENRATV